MTKAFFKLTLTVIIVLSLSVAAFAQKGAITGKVTDANSGEGLIGTNVIIQGTAMGAASGMDGVYKISGVPAGNYKLTVSFMGYKMMAKEVTVEAGQTMTVDFAMQEDVIYGEAIAIVANRAKVRETPVAFTDVQKVEMEARLGSQDIPLVLNTTPSVYATMQGGGAGDARINVRGFSQINMAVMINGVPINDMENGWVYWSNWDGVGDATSSIQVQRGLSAVNLATPSIGGTMNIITDPTAQTAGGTFKQEFGNDGFLKSTLLLNSGLINDKFAFSGGVVRKLGDGLIEKTWTDAWAYYFGAAWNINANNRLELYALGAPQRHGQNSYMQNIGVYSNSFAKDLKDYDEAALTTFREVGRKYNQTWGPVSSSYKGQQEWNGNVNDRFNEDFINERENYYHKPQVNLNWYTKLTDKLNLYSIVYYSGGTGGGTGTYGSLKWDYTKPSRTADWDATIAANEANATGSKGILRNSVNNQWTIGAISKASYKLAESINVTAGIDWRTAQIEHYRTVRDLLGGDYFYYTGNQFDTQADYNKVLGDRIDYDFDNTVDWIGGFGQAEYTSGAISAYGMAGYSTIKYSYTNHFRKDADGNEVTSESDRIGGYQVKGGANYRLTSALNVFANVGFVSKVPIFDNVINDRTGTKAEDPKNEQFVSFEAGMNWMGLDNTLTTKLNLYHTSWKDRANSVDIINEDGSEGIIFVTGMDALHQGVEFEAAYQPMPLFRLDAAASLGDWTLTDNVSGVYKDYTNPNNPEVEKNYYVKDLKVGDAPQTQIALAGSVYPVSGVMAQVVFRHYRDHYANWDPFSRTNPDEEGVQSWMAPNYSVIDLHASYNLPFNISGIKMKLMAHVFNALDAEYIQDALDNSPYNAYKVNGAIANPHKADAAEVFMGLPRTFNVGLSLSY